MDFNVIESSDAIRLTFNAWPHSKLEATRCVLPLAAMYTPSKVLPNMPVSFGRWFSPPRPTHDSERGARGENDGQGRQPMSTPRRRRQN